MTMKTFGQSYDGQLMKHTMSGLLYMMNGKKYMDLAMHQLEHAAIRPGDSTAEKALKDKVGGFKNIFNEEGIEALSHALYVVLDTLFEAQADTIRAAAAAIKSEELEEHIESLRKSWLLAICGTAGKMAQGVHVKKEVTKDVEFKRGF